VQNQTAIEVTPGNIDSQFALDEPLLATAPLMELLSEYVCEGGQMDADDCRWYHSAWQYLRMLDLVSTPSWHAEFYLESLGRLARSSEHPRVLVSGTADYSMLAYVLHASLQAGSRFDVTVLDMCETPLHLCRWYAAHLSSRISTIRQSIFNYAPRTKFDAIVADAFLTRFESEDRALVLQKWRSLLRRRGVVITTCRILGEQESLGRVMSTPEEISRFGSRATSLASFWQAFVHTSPEAIGKLATYYAERMISRPFLDEADVRRAFESAGFRIEELTVRQAKGEMKPVTYIEVVAQAV
jgi:hypothetical protein